MGTRLWNNANFTSSKEGRQAVMFSRKHWPLQDRLHILTIFSQYVLDLLLYVKESFSSFTQRSKTHLHNTRRSGNLDMPRRRLPKSLNSFPVMAIKFYNTLPEQVRQADNRKFMQVVWARLLSGPFYSLKEFLEDQWRGGHPLPQWPVIFVLKKYSLSIWLSLSRIIWSKTLQR